MEQELVIRVGTAIVRVEPTRDPTVWALQIEIGKLMAYAVTRTVATVEEVALATDDLGMMATLKKAVEAKRKEYIDPINVYLREINDSFKTIIAPLERADSLTRQKIMTWKREEARKAAEIAEINRMRQEAARREAALSGGELSEPTQLLEEQPAPPARVHGEAATLGTMTTWDYEVTDFASLPDEYKMVFASKLGRVVRAGLRTIPGVRIFPKETLSVRGR